MNCSEKGQKMGGLLKIFGFVLLDFEGNTVVYAGA